MMNLKTLYFIPVPDMIYCPEYSCPGFQNPNSICFQCVTENWNIFFKIDWICPFGLSVPQLQWRYNLWVNVNKVWLNCLSIENSNPALRLISWYASRSIFVELQSVWSVHGVSEAKVSDVSNIGPAGGSHSLPGELLVISMRKESDKEYSRIYLKYLKMLFAYPEQYWTGSPHLLAIFVPSTTVVKIMQL